jgi:hypothetical protein
MSGILTLVGTRSVGTYRTSGATAAFTPNASRILIAVVACVQTGVTVSGITGHGTWSRIATISGSGSQLEVWACKTSASPSSSAVTVSHSSSSSLLEVFECSSSYGGATAAAAFVQSGTFSAYVTGTPANHDISVTLGAFASGSNAAFICGFVIAATNSWTNQGSLTDENDYQSSPYCIHLSSAVGQDLSPGLTSTSDYALYLAIAFELAAVSGTQSLTVTPAGGITIAGTATNARIRTKSGAGGITLSGAATQVRKAARDTAGGIQIAGAASLNRARVAVPAGGLQTGGAASVSSSGTQQFTYAAQGGLQLGGASSQLRTRATLPAGGIVISGAASLSTHEALRTVTPSGGLNLRGAASVQSQSAGGSSASDWIIRRRRR